MPSPLVVTIVSVLAFGACMALLYLVSRLQDRHEDSLYSVSQDARVESHEHFEDVPDRDFDISPRAYYDDDLDAWIPNLVAPITLSDLRSAVSHDVQYQRDTHVKPQIVPGRGVIAKNITLPIGRITGSQNDYSVQLAHTIIGRKTGGGKTNILVRMGVEALAQGCEVWFVTPKYMRIDENDGLDLDGFARRVDRLVIDADFGKSALEALEDAVSLINARVTSSHLGPLQHRPLVMIVDEAKAYNAAWRMLEVQEAQKNATKRGKAAIEYILATGRQAEVFLLTSGQDCQAGSLDLNRGTQSNFLVKIGHSSLDRHSMENILPRGVNEESLPVAQGRHDWYVVTDNDNGAAEVALVTVPRVTNEIIEDRIGSIAVKRETVLASSVEEKAEPKADSSERAAPKEAPVAEDRLALRGSVPAQTYALIAYLIGTGASQRDIAKKVYNVEDGGGSYSVKIRPIIEAVRRDIESGSSVTVTVTDQEKPEKTTKTAPDLAVTPVTPTASNIAVTEAKSPSDIVIPPFVQAAIDKKP